ncbi:MAG: class I SAM-dependent methyltransferase [Acidobacteriota bacterium]
MENDFGFNLTCANCGNDSMDVFYEVQSVPAYSVRLLASRADAFNCPRGDLCLAHCSCCGFISNVAFESHVNPYSDGYEATQSYSPTFDAFARRLAVDLVERHKLRGKTILEIGCGMGEFLALLCELGENRGIGFDPAYVEGRISTPALDRIEFRKEFFSDRHAGIQADVVVCKMTLEHIPRVRDFVSMIRRALGPQSRTLVFFQVPDMTRILEERAFWDLYYEHCSYFSPASLGHLFSSCSFEVLDMRTDYAGQYLLIEAKPAPSCSNHRDPELIEALARKVTDFVNDIGTWIIAWKRLIEDQARAGRRTALWGGGSKAVAFLTTLDLTDQIACVVDINPHKHGTYVAGTGQPIVGPDRLREYQPDTVIVMNPVYRAEIGGWLNSRGFTSEIRSVEDAPWRGAQS